MDFNIGYLHSFSKISFLPVGKHQLCIQSKHHLLLEYPPHSILNPIRCWPRADLESMHEKWTLKWVFWCFMQKPILVSVGLWSFHFHGSNLALQFITKYNILKVNFYCWEYKKFGLWLNTEFFKIIIHLSTSMFPTSILFKDLFF